MEQWKDGKIGTLYLGDNKDVMEDLDENTVDLCYIDPPFYTKKNRGDYNDRWDSFEDYINFMSERINLIYSLLKPSGILYLHCDPRASHYLKIECDKIFSMKNFLNEIIWCYSGGGIPKKDYPRKHDVILRYVKDINSDYYHDPPLHAYKGNSWHGDGSRYDLINDKTPVPDWWGDIPPLHSHDKENRGYDSQKPFRLLERIIKTSSRKGDLVLDAFYGSGTTLIVAKKLGRKYIGMDETKKAYDVTKVALMKTTIEKKITDYMHL